MFCSFQTIIYTDIENLVVNAALLQLVGVPAPSQPYHTPSIRALSEEDRKYYDHSTQCIEELALYLKYNGNGNVFLFIYLYVHTIDWMLLTIECLYRRAQCQQAFSAYATKTRHFGTMCPSRRGRSRTSL